MTGLENPVFTLAIQRSPTGFTTNQIAYSTDGSTFTDFGTTYTPAASFALLTWDLSAINALDSATSETTTGLLGALALLGILRRRRNFQ